MLEQQLTRPILTQARVHFTATFRYHTHSECAEVVLLTDLFSPSESQYFGNYNRWLHLIWVLLPVISREKGAWAIFLTQAWSPFQTFCCCINFPPWTQHQPTLSQGLLLVKCSASNLNSVLSLWHRFSSVLGGFIQLNLKSKATSQYSYMCSAPIVVLPVFVPPASKYLFTHARDSLHSGVTQSWWIFLVRIWSSS